MTVPLWFVTFGVVTLIAANIAFRPAYRLSIVLFVLGLGIGIAGFIGMILWD